MREITKTKTKGSYLDYGHVISDVVEYHSRLVEVVKLSSKDVRVVKPDLAIELNAMGIVTQRFRVLEYDGGYECCRHCVEIGNRGGNVMGIEEYALQGSITSCDAFTSEFNVRSFTCRVCDSEHRRCCITFKFTRMDAYDWHELHYR